MPKLTIAIDGPGSSGKGTIARGVARTLGYQYVDTGAMYRSVALVCQQRGVDWQDAEAAAEVARSLQFRFQWDGDILRIIVDDADVTGLIRTGEIGTGASNVSKHPPVRAALLELQRELGAAGGVVMDGRDIGTIVLPEADLKVYLDADVQERARRRHEELLRRGEVQPYSNVLETLAARDKQDMERDTAPLRAADDAVTIDSTGMTIRQAVDTVLTLASERGA